MNQSCKSKERGNRRRATGKGEQTFSAGLPAHVHFLKRPGGKDSCKPDADSSPSWHCILPPSSLVFVCKPGFSQKHPQNWHRLATCSQRARARLPGKQNSLLVPTGALANQGREKWKGQLQCGFLLCKLRPSFQLLTSCLRKEQCMGCNRQIAEHEPGRLG